MVERQGNSGWYLYGLIDSHPPTNTLLDLDHVRCLRFRDMAALVVEVSLDEFDESQLKERLNDPKWLERKLWAHEQVLERALGMATVIPMKFATIFKSELRLLAELEAHYDGVVELFKKLKGRHEYGLKAFLDRRLLEAEVEQTHAQAMALKEHLLGQPEGTAYLMRKQLSKLIEEEVEKRLHQHLQTIYERLGDVADERRLNLATAEQVVERHAEMVPPPALGPKGPRSSNGPPSAKKAGGGMVLNAALLVATDRREELLVAVARLQGEFTPFGYSFKLVGPFPPYNFSRLPELVSDKRAP